MADKFTGYTDPKQKTKADAAKNASKAAEYVTNSLNQIAYNATESKMVDARTSSSGPKTSDAGSGDIGSSVSRASDRSNSLGASGRASDRSNSLGASGRASDYGTGAGHFRVGPDISKSKISDNQGIPQSGRTQTGMIPIDGKAMAQEGANPLKSKATNKTRTTELGQNAFSEQAKAIEATGAVAKQTTAPIQGAGASAISRNAGASDMTAIANAAVDSMNSRVSNPDMPQPGQKWGTVDESSRYANSSGRYTVEDTLFGNDHAINKHHFSNKESYHVNPHDVKNIIPKYIAAEDRSGNILADYRTNVHVVEEYISQYKIDASKLTLSEIREALSKGRFNKGMFYGDGVDLRGNGDLTKALTELAFLRQQKDAVESFSGVNRQTSSSSPLAKRGGLTKAVLRKTYEGTDAADGLDMTMSAAGVLSAGHWMAKGTAGAGINAGITATQLGEKVVVGTQKALAKHNLSKATTTDDIVKWRSVIESKNNRLKVIDTGKRAKAKQAVRYTVKTNGKQKIKDGAKAIGKASGIMNWAPFGHGVSLSFLNTRFVAPVRNFLQRNIFIKAIKAPVKAVSAASLFASKLKIYVGIAVIVVILLIGIISLLVNFLIPTSGEGDLTEGNLLIMDDSYEYSNAQWAIDYCYRNQYCYVHNLTQLAGKDEVDPVSGLKYYKFGLPENWHLHEAEVPNDQAINDGTMTAVYAPANEVTGEYEAQDHEITMMEAKYGAEKGDEEVIVGYNLNHYWGPFDHQGQWEFQNQGNEAHTVTVGHYNEDPDSGVDHEIWYYKTEEVMTIVNGIGGLGQFGETDIGTYYSYDHVPIQKDSAAYEANRHNINKYVKVKWMYFGSAYSYELSDAKSNTYQTEDGRYEKYTTSDLYKGFTCAGLGFVGNEREKYENWRDYEKMLFDFVMENATITMRTTWTEDPDNIVTWKYIDPIILEVEGEEAATTECWDHSRIANVEVKVWIKDSGIQNMIDLSEHPEHSKSFTLGDALKDNYGGINQKWAYELTDYWNERPADAETKKDINHGLYRDPEKLGGGERNTYEGYYDKDGIWDMSDDMMHAVMYYDLDNVDWEGFFPGIGIRLPDQIIVLGEELIDNFIEEMEEYYAENVIEEDIFGNWFDGTMSADREAAIRFALACVGKINYHYGRKYRTDNSKTQLELDCSGFISYVLYKSGVDTSALGISSCWGFLHTYPSTRYTGDPSTLTPGTLLVKNGAQGGKDTSINHIKMYIGKYDYNGDGVEEDCVIENSSSKGGVVISPASSVNGYSYAVNPFSS